MGQLGFFDLSRRYAGLDGKNDPLVALAVMVPWASLASTARASDLARLGSRIDELEKAGRTVIAVGRNGRPQGILALGDTLRPDAVETIAALGQPRRSAPDDQAVEAFSIHSRHSMHPFADGQEHWCS